MSWAKGHIERLQKGETVKFRPHGNSMSGKVESGQLCTVEPITEAQIIQVGDVVLCTVHGRDFLHLVKAINSDGSQVQIGNNRGHINGWTRKTKVHGRLTKVEP